MKALLAIVLLLAAPLSGLLAEQRPPLAEADILDIAQIVKLEDSRQFDEAALSRFLAARHPEVLPTKAQA